MGRYANLAALKVPQSEPLDERQVENNAGGFVYQIDDWARLERFLILGSDSNTYYQSARELTRENSSCVTRCYDADLTRTLDTIYKVSHDGRAPKNDAAIFALALGVAHSHEKVRKAALCALPYVCRTSTHLFQFISNLKALKKGWGRAVKRAVASWYNTKTVDQVAYQAIKYREREGYTHKRVLELAHVPSRNDAVRTSLYRWMKGKDALPLPNLVLGHLAAMSETNEDMLVSLIEKHKLPWEAIPTQAKTNPKVWQAMIPHLGLTALIRNLGAMSKCEAIKPLSPYTDDVIERIIDGAELKKARVHPFTILQALATYRQGHGNRYNASTWPVIGPVVDALDDAFYVSFDHIEPTGKRTLIALDVSGSMGAQFQDSALTVREAAACMAMVAARTERTHHIIGFTSAGAAFTAAGSRRMFGYSGGNAVAPLDISPKMRLDRIVKATSNLPFGATDCALPMLYATAKKLDVDVFQVYTDNETWAGGVHPMEALRDYRKQSGINAKLVVVGMTATEFSIADKNDPNTMDVVGFDSAAPAVIADFARW